MSAGIDVAIEIDDGLTAQLQRAIAAGIDLSPAMGDIAGHMADRSRESFETSRSPLGLPWKPSRRAIEEGGKTLVDRGDLVGSIRENWGADFAEAGPERSGGAAVYAAIHQFGGTIVPRLAQALSFAGRIVAKVVIPAREYLGWAPQDNEYAIDTIAAHLARAFGTGGEASA